MKALVTGAHGFIGSHLTEGLLARGFEVRALVSPWGRTDFLKAVRDHPRLELVRADITKPESLGGSCRGVELLFHAAARVADWGPWEAFYQANVLGTEHLLHEAARSGVRRFVFVSSVAVHRYTGFRNADTRRLAKDNDINAYARSKVMADERVSETTELETVIVRPGLWPFGPRNPEVARAAQALQRGVLPLVSGGRAVLNTAYIGNFVDGLILAGTVPAAAGRSYVIADEGMPSWRRIFLRLAKLLGTAPPRLSVPGQLTEAAGNLVEGVYTRLAPAQAPPLTRYGGALMRQDVHFSIEHARQELGYAPRWSWREGLERTVQTLR